MKIVINACYGGFGLSLAAVQRYAELKGATLSFKESKLPGFYHYRLNDKYFDDDEMSRDDPDLVRVVEELGAAANGSCADLKIVIVPDGIDWQIEEYDGTEWVSEKHRAWG